jgi:predicted nucleic acid-binding protein
LTQSGQALYWDASAVLSLFFHEEHTHEAVQCYASSASHVLSSLAFAEALSAVERASREGTQGAQTVDAARSVLARARWWQVDLVPHRRKTGELARAYRLRGADLWHLALAKTLRSHLPNLRLLTFDARLHEAAVAEGLA